MKNLNSIRLIIITFIDSIVSSAFVIGVLFYLQQTNRELFANSLVANLSSVALIIVTLFIGATIDRKSKKSILILSNILLACIAWLPGYFYESKSFFVVLLIVDLIVAILNLMSNSSAESYLKGAIEEKDLKKTISFIQLMAMTGFVLGIILMSYSMDHFSAKTFFASASLFYLINLIVILQLSKDEEIANKKSSKVLEEIKVGFNYIKNRKFLRSNVFLTVSLSSTQGFIASLVIYYWSSIDSNFEQINLLLLCLGIGLIGGMILINLLKGESKYTVSIFCIISSISMCFMFLCKTPLTLAITLGTIIGCIQVAGVTLKTQRIKLTDVKVQGRISSLNNMFSSILTLIIATGVSYIGQLFHLSYLPIIVLALLNIAFLMPYFVSDFEESTYLNKTNNVQELGISTANIVIEKGELRDKK